MNNEIVVCRKKTNSCTYKIHTHTAQPWQTAQPCAKCTISWFTHSKSTKHDYYTNANGILLDKALLCVMCRSLCAYVHHRHVSDGKFHGPANGQTSDWSFSVIFRSASNLSLCSFGYTSIPLDKCPCARAHYGWESARARHWAIDKSGQRSRERAKCIYYF